MRIKYTELKLRQEHRDELQEWNDARSEFIGRYTDESCNAHREAMLNAHRVMALSLEHCKRCKQECNEPKPAGRSTDAIETDLREFISERDALQGFTVQYDPRGCTVSIFFRSRTQGREPGDDSDRYAIPQIVKPDWTRDFQPFIGTEYEANA